MRLGIISRAVPLGNPARMILIIYQEPAVAVGASRFRPLPEKSSQRLDLIENLLLYARTGAQVQRLAALDQTDAPTFP